MDEMMAICGLAFPPILFIYILWGHFSYPSGWIAVLWGVLSFIMGIIITHVVWTRHYTNPDYQSLSAFGYVTFGSIVFGILSMATGHLTLF